MRNVGSGGFRVHTGMLAGSVGLFGNLFEMPSRSGGKSFRERLDAQ